ncbi:MAG: hypothetical protein H7274_24355 [Rhodoferax sp.]|nr:hypothetical protein [Rhodoferax sp.]
MSEPCHPTQHPTPRNSSVLPQSRPTLWIALVSDALMFLVDISAGYRSGSVSLPDDAIDFGSDAANYAVSGLWYGAAPDPTTKGVVGALASSVNLVVACLLYAVREGDAKMRSVWFSGRVTGRLRRSADAGAGRLQKSGALPACARRHIRWQGPRRRPVAQRRAARRPGLWQHHA